MRARQWKIKYDFCKSWRIIQNIGHIPVYLYSILVKLQKRDAGYKRRMFPEIIVPIKCLPC